MSKYDCYIICTSPRSGSTLLCRMLQETGIAGHPESWFHRPSVADWRSDLDLKPRDGDLRDTLSTAMTQGRGGSDLFALRLQRHSFDSLMSQLAQLAPSASTDTKRLASAFGRIRYIHLSRPDTLAQAVSYVRASQSGLWHRNADGSELERLAPPQEPAYDRSAIARELGVLTAQNTAWLTWFAKEGIEPLTLTYDQLDDDPIGVLSQVLDDLGLDAAVAQAIDAPTARLADKINSDWIAQFLDGA